MIDNLPLRLCLAVTPTRPRAQAGYYEADLFNFGLIMCGPGIEARTWCVRRPLQPRAPGAAAAVLLLYLRLSNRRAFPAYEIM